MGKRVLWLFRLYRSRRSWLVHRVRCVYGIFGQVRNYFRYLILVLRRLHLWVILSSGWGMTVVYTGIGGSWEHSRLWISSRTKAKVKGYSFRRSSRSSSNSREWSNSRGSSNFTSRRRVRLIRWSLVTLSLLFHLRLTSSRRRDLDLWVPMEQSTKDRSQTHKM
jgi:hypothetical protein